MGDVWIEEIAVDLKEIAGDLEEIAGDLEEMANVSSGAGPTSLLCPASSASPPSSPAHQQLIIRSLQLIVGSLAGH